MNRYLKKYLAKYTIQDIQNYCMIAIFVENEKKIYVPKAEWLSLEHFHMRKKFEKTLEGCIERERSTKDNKKS